MSENYTPIAAQLPSRCLVYPGVDPTKSPDQISIRSFKGKDEQLIAELSLENFNKKFAVILKNVLKGIDPLKLTLGDRLYLMIWETINSYSKDFTITHECEHCWKKFEYVVDLSELPNLGLPEDFKEPYPVLLPKANQTVNLRLLRVEDLLKVDEMSKMDKPVWLYRYALTIVNDRPVLENVEFLENLHTKDLAVIRRFHEQMEHGPKMQAEYTCECGGAGLVPVSFRLEMFLPSGEELKRCVGDAVRSNVLPASVDRSV